MSEFEYISKINLSKSDNFLLFTFYCDLPDKNYSVFYYSLYFDGVYYRIACNWNYMYARVSVNKQKSI